jgi:hypothetical protein
MNFKVNIYCYCNNCFILFKAYGITEDTRYNLNNEYVYKGLAMMGGVYLFYLVEKILKIMIHIKKVKYFLFI